MLLSHVLLNDVCGCVEVVRLMGMHCMMRSGDDANSMNLFVARSRFRPPAYEAGALMDTDTVPAKMEDWVGIVWKILAERGGVCRANELFASLPRLQKAFTSRFPSPGPLVKAGTQSGVLFSLKVPGASLVQLSKAEHSVVDLTVPVRHLFNRALVVLLICRAEARGGGATQKATTTAAAIAGRREGGQDRQDGRRQRTTGRRCAAERSRGRAAG